MFFLILLFKLSCDIYYKYSFGLDYSYYLFENNFSATKYLLSWIFVLLLSFRFRKVFTNKKTEKISTYLIFVLYLISFIPTMTLCAFENLPVKFMILVSLFWGVTLVLEYYFCACQRVKAGYNRKQVLKLSRNTQKTLQSSACVIVACFVLGFSYHYTHFNINLDLNDIYAMRYGEIRSLSGVLQYIYIWVGIAISVLGMYAFQKKNYGQFTIWVFLLVLYFSIEGNKITLFLIPVSLLAIGGNLKKNMWLIPALFIFLNIGGVLESHLTDLHFINGYWGLRTLFLPSNLTHMYYDYFSVNGPDYWARSFLRHFGAVSKYDKDFGHIIDIVYFHLSGEGNSNTGMFGSAYANFGDLCIIVYPCVYLVVFKLVNWFTKSIPVEKCYTFLFYYAMVLQNSDPFGVMMTNGLLVIGLLYKFVLYNDPPKGKVKNYKKCVA